MRNATKFIEDAQKIQREYYLGKIQHETALAMLDELMRHHHIISGDEILVDIPECFKQTGDVECEFTGGEFTIRHEGDPYTWKRSFPSNMPYSRVQNQNLPDPDTIFYTPQRRRVVGSMHLRASNVPPPSSLSKEQENFFASYEEQMVGAIFTLHSQRARVSAQFLGLNSI